MLSGAEIVVELIEPNISNRLNTGSGNLSATNKTKKVEIKAEFLKGIPEELSTILEK